MSSAVQRELQPESYSVLPVGPARQPQTDIELGRDETGNAAVKRSKMANTVGQTSRHSEAMVATGPHHRTGAVGAARQIHRDRELGSDATGNAAAIPLIIANTVGRQTRGDRKAMVAPWPHCPRSIVSIWRIPNFLKESRNKNAYIPKAVSLGPYHRRRAKLSRMDNHKSTALLSLIQRFKNSHPIANDRDSKDFFSLAKQKISELEDQIKKSYEENFVLEPENLALDGCFILEILRTLSGEALESTERYEPIFHAIRLDYTGFDILNDLFKLENQIPFIVLRSLLQLELPNNTDADNKLWEILFYGLLDKLYPFKLEYKITWQIGEVHHLLHLLHRLIVSRCSDHNGSADRNGIKTPPASRCSRIKKCRSDVERLPVGAVELRNAGIQFEGIEEGIDAITFDANRTTIRLPKITITDHTEVLFRNLIALELCHASEINFVTCYLSLMDELIDSEADVSLLQRSGVVINYLGSNAEVAELFNGLCRRVTVSRKDYFAELKTEVDCHYKRSWKVRFAEFVNDRLSSPWTIAALAGAMVGLILAAVQTIFIIISTYK